MITSLKPIRFLAAAAVVNDDGGLHGPGRARTGHDRAAAPEIPDTPAGKQLRWLLDELASRPPIPESELKEHFAADFLQDFPPTSSTRP